MTDTPMQPIISLQDFLIDRVAAVPDDIRDKLREILTSTQALPLRVKELGEFIYARRDVCPPSLLAIGIEAMQMLITYSQLGYQDGRGAGIIAGLVEAGGKLATVAAPAEPPEPMTEYLPATDPAKEAQRSVAGCFRPATRGSILQHSVKLGFDPPRRLTAPRSSVGEEVADNRTASVKIIVFIN